MPVAEPGIDRQVHAELSELTMALSALAAEGRTATKLFGIIPSRYGAHGELLEVGLFRSLAVCHLHGHMAHGLAQSRLQTRTTVVAGHRVKDVAQKMESTAAN